METIVKKGLNRGSIISIAITIISIIAIGFKSNEIIKESAKKSRKWFL